MANTHMKRYSTLLITRELQVETTMRYHLTLVRMNLTKNRCWKGVEKKEPSSIVGKNVNYSHYGEQYGVSLEN